MLHAGRAEGRQGVDEGFIDILILSKGKPRRKKKKAKKEENKGYKIMRFLFPTKGKVSKSVCFAFRNKHVKATIGALINKVNPMFA